MCLEGSKAPFSQAHSLLSQTTGNPFPPLDSTWSRGIEAAALENVSASSVAHGEGAGPCVLL